MVINDITSDNLIIGVDPSASLTPFFPGAHVTTGIASSTTYKGSGVINYQNDASSISVQMNDGDASKDNYILNQNTFEATSDAKLITSVQTDHIFNLYVGEPFRLSPNL